VTEKASLLQSWGCLSGWTGDLAGESQPPTASPKVTGGGGGGGGVARTVRRRAKMMFKS